MRTLSAKNLKKLERDKTATEKDILKTFTRLFEKPEKLGSGIFCANLAYLSKLLAESRRYAMRYNGGKPTRTVAKRK